MLCFLQVRQALISYQDYHMLWLTLAGPDTLLLETNAASLEGRFHVYDTDYRNASSRGTLLYTSAVVAVEPGDTWAFEP